MKFASATDTAIAIALTRKTLRVEVCESTYGYGKFYAICDSFGTIEVHFSMDDVKARIKAVEEA